MSLIKLNATRGLQGTLPAVSGANLTNIDGGKVLQVVGANISGGNVNIASTTYTDTGNTVTITPSSSSSKIMIFARGGYSLGATDDTVQGGIKLVRNSTTLVSPMADTAGPYEIALELTSGTHINNLNAYYNYCFLDTPNTTSACVYKLQARVYNTANSHHINFGNTGAGGGGQSQQMIAQEVSG